MTFCTCSETNHVLTAFPICEGVGFIDSTFMISASSRSSNISGVVIAVPTPTPEVSESDEKKEVPVDIDEGEGPSESVLSPTPKFKTRLLVPEETEDDEEDERLSVETEGDGTTNIGDGGGAGGVAGASDPIFTLFIDNLALCAVAIDLSFLASSALSLWNTNFLSISDPRVRSLLLPLKLSLYCFRMVATCLSMYDFSFKESTRHTTVTLSAMTRLLLNYIFFSMF